MTTHPRHTRHGAELWRKASAAGLLALFLFYFIGVTLFTHTHQFGTITVVHSHYYAHPWKTASDTTPAHSHSAEQLQTIQHLDYFIFILTAVGLVCTAFRQISSLSVYDRRTCSDTGRPHFTTRGPPALA